MLFSKGKINKKGSMILMAVYEILAVLVIIFILMSTADAFGKSDITFKINAVEDIRMMVNTLVGVPGDAIVEYPHDVSEYFFVLSQNKISMFKEDEKDKKVVRTFFVPEGYTAQGVVKGQKEFCLEKRGKTILLKGCEEEFVEVPAKIIGEFEEGFLEKVKEVANYFGFDPNYLLAVMHWETGGTFDPAQKNIAGSGATGLIQFMPSTAEGLGTTTEELAQMSQVEQMEYVKKHFEGLGGKKARTLSDVYMVVLYPKAVGKPESYVLFSSPSKAYTQNRGLDIDKNGKITKQEAASKVQKSYEIIIKNE